MNEENADWNRIWSKSYKFDYGSLKDWEKDIFVNISSLLTDLQNPQILSAGCGRGLIDYWLVKVYGYKVILLDYSTNCVKNLKKAFKRVDKSKFEIRQASILSMPFPDSSFDLVWNEGVLEHFKKDDYGQSIREMVRVSKKYVLIDVPYAKSKPYTISKDWLEKNGLWIWGYENPKNSLKDNLTSLDMEVIKEIPIGSIQTNKNYVNMVPLEHQGEVLKLLTKNDFGVFPHLMTIAKKRASN